VTNGGGDVGAGTERFANRPIERLRGGLAPLVLYPLLALLSFPTLGLLLYGRDGVAYSHDVFDLVRSGVVGDWLANGPTLWNTHLTGGNALLAQQAIGPYAIDVPLAMLIGPFGAFAVNSWLLAAVAGMGMHLFLRDVLRLSTVAVLAGAILYTFVFWHPIYGFVVPGLPLLLWLLDGASRRTPVRWRFVVGRVLWIAFVLYNGQSQGALLVAGLELAWILVQAGGDRLLLRRALAAWFGTWLAGFALYGPVLITQLVMLPLSQRLIWVLADFLPADALTAAVRRYSSVLFAARVAPGIGNSPTIYGTFFLGAVGIALAALAIVHPGRDRRRWFLLGLLIAIPIADVVATSIQPLLDSFGFLKSFQLNRVRHLFPFALVGAAACGMDVLIVRLLRGEPVVRGWRALLVSVALVPAVGTLAVAVGQTIQRRAALGALEPAAVGWFAAGVALVIGLVAVIALLAWGSRRPRSSKAAAVVLAGLLLVVVVERPVYAYAERLMGTDLSTWEADVDVTPGIAFLRGQPEIGLERVLAFGEEPARLAAAGLQQIDGYEVMYPLPYHALFGALTAPELADRPDRWRFFHHWGNRAVTFGPRVDPELLALLGVRWLYVRGDEIPTVPGIVERFRDGDVAVYEVPEPLPRAFVVDDVAVLPTEEAVVDALAAADLDSLRQTAFIAAGPDADELEAGGGIASDDQPGTATVTRYTPDEVRVLVEGGGGVLVLTDTWAPGWQVTVDGRAVPIHRVDGALRGAVVGPGSHEVEFRYVPTFTYVGFLLALLGLGGTIAAALILRSRDRP
jgi:Bacterial membrane protein YfhO/Protein of unknown function (DUF6044)